MRESQHPPFFPLETSSRGNLDEVYPRLEARATDMRWLVRARNITLSSRLTHVRHKQLGRHKSSTGLKQSIYQRAGELERRGEGREKGGREGGREGGIGLFVSFRRKRRAVLLDIWSLPCLPILTLLCEYSPSTAPLCQSSAPVSMIVRDGRDLYFAHEVNPVLESGLGLQRLCLFDDRQRSHKLRTIHGDLRNLHRRRVSL